MSDQQQLVVSSQDSLFNMVAQAATDPAVDAAKLTALYGLQRQIRADMARDSFYVALRAAQAQIPPITKGGTIDLGEKDGRKRGAIPFAKYEDMRAVIDPILKPLGLFMTHTMRGATDGSFVVVSTLHHTQGHTLDAEFPLPRDTGPGRNPLQAGGSTFSYGRRYNTENLLDLVRKGADDDGREGGTRLVTAAEAEELRGLCRDAGRQEGPFLARLFADTVHTFDEIEAGPAHLAARGTLMGILHQQSQRKKGEG